MLANFTSLDIVVLTAYGIGILVLGATLGGRQRGARDYFLAGRIVPSLAAGISDNGAVVLPIPSATQAGTYYLIVKADADDLIKESVETNNTFSRSISISAAP